MSGEFIQFKLGRELWTGRVLRRNRFSVIVEHKYRVYNPWAEQWIDKTDARRIPNRNIFTNPTEEGTQ